VSCQYSWGMPLLRGCASNFDAGGSCRDGAAGQGSVASGADRVSYPSSLGRSWLFPNDVVQRDDKDDEGDGGQESPVVFAREVDTRAVNFDNGDGSIVDLDCHYGKKCRNGEDSSTEDVGFIFEFHLDRRSPGPWAWCPGNSSIC